MSSAWGRVHLGDCLEVLPAEVAPGSVDLCYLDPPFFTGRDHGAFDDRWSWGPHAEADLATAGRRGPEGFERQLRGLLEACADPSLGAYLCFLAARLVEVRHALADHGAMFLHVDPTAGPALRLLCDALFGRQNFLNEVIWRYRRWPVKQQAFQRMHDVLLYHAKDAGHPDRRFSTLYEPRAPSTLKRWGEAKIRASHRQDGSRAPSQGELEPSDGAPLSDVWELPIIAPSAHERTGYPTQKPLRLLERIVAVASVEGDYVLDPFCGSGTALEAAAGLGRRCTGIDVSDDALRLARQRLAPPTSPATGSRPRGS